MTALAARSSYSPFVAGTELSLADFGAAIHLPLVSIVCKAIYDEDLLEAVPGVREHRALMGERTSLKQVKADRAEDVPRFMEHRATIAAEV